MSDRKAALDGKAVGRTTTFLIEIGDQDVGLAMMEQGGARFIASDPRLMSLDGRHFPSIEKLRRVAGEAVAAHDGVGGTARQPLAS